MPCRKCGYDLIGLDANPDCPECGTLNLHSEPYRGVEVFRYSPHRHSKTLLIIIGLFALFILLMIIDRHTGSNPPQRPPSLPFEFLLIVGTVVLGGYALSRFYSSNGQVSLDWDNHTIILNNAVRTKWLLPRKLSHVEFKMTQLQSMGKGNPMGPIYDVIRLLVIAALLRTKVPPSWTYLVFPKCRIYLHKSFDDRELLDLRLSRLCTTPRSSIPASQRVFKLPLVVAILVILGATATLVWLAIRNDFWI